MSTRPLHRIWLDNTTYPSVLKLIRNSSIQTYIPINLTSLSRFELVLWTTFIEIPIHHLYFLGCRVNFVCAYLYSGLVNYEIALEWAGWDSGNTEDLYSGCTWFKSRPANPMQRLITRLNRLESVTNISSTTDTIGITPWFCHQNLVCYTRVNRRKLSLTLR